MMNEGMAGTDRNEYMAVAREFNPSEFDAKKIAKLAKEAGMKYIIITSKHHDGFCHVSLRMQPFQHRRCHSFRPRSDEGTRGSL